MARITMKRFFTNHYYLLSNDKCSTFIFVGLYGTLAGQRM